MHASLDRSPIAQLVEQRTVNPFVAGSSPARGAISNTVVLSDTISKINYLF